MANEIKTVESKEKLAGNVSQGGFVAAASGIASVNSTQNNIGMQIADGATMRLMDYVGTDLGKNPRGDILTIPGISYTDKLQASYSAQSQVALGLRAQDAFNAANLELAQKRQLSPDDIVQYQKTMTDVIQDTAKLAPHGAKENLEKSLYSELSNKVYQNNIRMTKEEQDRQDSHNAVYNSEGLKAVTEANNLGNDKDALEIMMSHIAVVDEQYKAGQISEETHQSKIDEYNKTYQSSKLTHKLIVASKERGSGEVEKILSAVPDKVPEGMRYADWISAAQDAYTNFKGVETFKSSQQAVLQTEAFSRVVQFGVDLTQDEYTSLHSKMPIKDYQDLRLKINSYLNPKNKAHNEQNDLIQNKDDSVLWLSSSSKNTMGAMVTVAGMISDSAQANGKPISYAESLSQAATQTPIAVPGYKQYIDNALSSGDTATAVENAKIMYSLKRSGIRGQRYQFDKQTEVAASKILEGLNNQMPANEAVALARAQVYTTSDSNNEHLKSSYNRYKSNLVANTGETLSTVARSELGKEEFDNAVYHDAITDEYFNVLGTYFNAAQGDLPTAKKLTKEYFDNNYGYTNINGKKQYVIHPAEHILGKDLNGSQFIINDDARQSIAKQFADINKKFEKGKSNVRIDFIKPQINGKDVTFEGLAALHDAYSTEKDVGKAKMLSKEYAEYKKAFVEGNAKLRVNATYLNGKKDELSVVLNGAPVMMKDGEQIGDWDVSFIEASGMPRPVQNIMGNYSQRIFYNGRSESLKNNIRRLAVTPFNLNLFEERKSSFLPYPNLGLLQQGSGTNP